MRISITDYNRKVIKYWINGSVFLLISILLFSGINSGYTINELFSGVHYVSCPEDSVSYCLNPCFNEYSVACERINNVEFIAPGVTIGNIPMWYDNQLDLFLIFLLSSAFFVVGVLLVDIN